MYHMMVRKPGEDWVYVNGVALSASEALVCQNYAVERGCAVKILRSAPNTLPKEEMNSDVVDLTNV